MLYHVTNPENTDSILENGLRPSNNREATDPLLVAEETRDRILDRHARERYGPEYPSRRDSVFFYTDPVFAVTEAEETGSDIIAVDEDDVGEGDVTFFSADRMAVEDLFDRIRSGVLEGGLTDPAYDGDAVEQEAECIVTDTFHEWTGAADADREVWCAYVIRPAAVSLFD